LADQILQIGASFDVAPIIAGSQQAVAAMDNLSEVIQRQAVIFQQQGLSEAEVNTKLQELGYSATEVSAALGGETAETEAVTAATEQYSAAANTAAASTGRMTSAMGAARVEMGALEGSTGMMAGGLARVAAQSATLAPLLTAAFPVFAAGAFIDIIVMMAEKLYKAYENVVLLKGAIEALDKATMAEAERAASLNVAYEESLARRLESQGKLTEAAAEYQRASGDKPLQVPKIDDKMFKQFNSEFVTFLQAVHSSKDAPSVITRINAEAESTAKQLEDAKERLKDLSDVSGEALAYGGPALFGNAQAQIEDLTKKLAFLKGMIGSIQSETGTTGNALADTLDRLGKKDTSGAFRDFELLNAQQELASKGAEEEARKIEETAKKKEEAERKVIDDYYKQFDLVQSIQEETSRAAKKELDDREKYSLESAKLAEEASVRAIAAAEKTVTETANIQKLALAGSGAGPMERARIEGEVNAKELADLKKLKEDEIAVQLKYAEDTRNILLAGQTPGQFQTANVENPEQQKLLLEADAKIVAAKAALVSTDAEYNAKMAENNLKTADQITAAWMKAFTPINRAFDQMVTGVIQGTQTISQVFARMGSNLVISMANAFAQIVLKSVEHEAAITLAHLVGEQTRVVTTTTAAGETKAITASTTLSEIAHDAAKAAAGAYQAVVGIPIIGPVLAPAAAVAAFAAVMAFESLAGAEQGAIIPGHVGEAVPIMAHGQEMMLPERISTPLQGVIPAMQKFNVAMGAGAPGAQGSAGAPGASPKANRVTHNNITINHNGTSMTHTDIIRAVKIGIRKGELLA
jgi:hypothetical protein